MFVFASRRTRITEERLPASQPRIICICSFNITLKHVLHEASEVVIVLQAFRHAFNASCLATARRHAGLRLATFDPIPIAIVPLHEARLKWTRITAMQLVGDGKG